MKTRDLARLYNVSQRTIQRWLSSGALDPSHAYRTQGGHWRIGRPPTLADLDPLEQAKAKLILADALDELHAFLEERNAPTEHQEDHPRKLIDWTD